MAEYVTVEPYVLRDLPGQRAVIRDPSHNEPRQVLAVDYQVDDLYAVARMWSLLCGLPLNEGRQA